MNRHSIIFVAGSGTLLGSAIVRRLDAQRFEGLVGRGPGEPDLRSLPAVDEFFARHGPSTSSSAGAQAGIGGNQRHPADLMIDNLRVATSVIPAASRHGTAKLVFLGSSCIYPKFASQPFEPGSLWTGPVEPTSAAYAVAKLAGMTLAAAYRQQHGSRFVTAIAADAYGPGDDFTEADSHVVAAVIRRIHHARATNAASVEIWGTGAPRREFIYVEDLADACLFVLAEYDGPEPINLGTGMTTSIAELTQHVREIAGYSGELRFDASRPDGTPFKGLDSSRLRALGWRPTSTLREGLERTYAWYAEGHRER